VADEEKKDEIQKANEKMEAHAAAADNIVADFFTFRMFITRPFIKVIYVLGALAITVMSILAMFGVGAAQTTGSTVLYGLLALIVGNLMWRVWCEAAIIFFSMYDVLKSVDDSLKES
jgi:hypothetical protein